MSDIASVPSVYASGVLAGKKKITPEQKKASYAKAAKERETLTYWKRDLKRWQGYVKKYDVPKFKKSTRGLNLIKTAKKHVEIAKLKIKALGG